MSDDSWALVEPPEEAFDPGPGWGSVPADPYDRRSPSPGVDQTSRPDRSAGQRGGPAAQASGTRPPERSGSHSAVGGVGQRPGDPVRPVPHTSARSGSAEPTGQDQRAPGPAPSGRADQRGPTPAGGSPGQVSDPAGGADQRAAERTASRSVVWSPPAAAPERAADRSADSNAKTVDRADPGDGLSPPVQSSVPLEAQPAQRAPESDGPVSPSEAGGPDASPAGARPAGPVIPSFIRTDAPADSRPGAAPAAQGSPGPGSMARGSAAVVAPGDAAERVGSPSDRPADPGNALRKPVSRYQKLLDEAERKRAEEAAAVRSTVDLRFVEDEPSADDETIEESGLVGRTAIERILNGRLVEERSLDGQ